MSAYLNEVTRELPISPLAFGVTAIQLYKGTPVSTGIVAVGVLSMLVAIPVKIGFKKRIKRKWNKR